MRYGYYTGCGITESEQEHEFSLKSVLDLLGLDIQEIPAPGCLGGMSGREEKELAIARDQLVARMHAECADTDVLIVPCSSCYRVIRSLENVENFPRILHPLELLTEEVSRDTMKSLRVRRLAGLKVTPYYGCLFKPLEGGEVEQEKPTYLEDIFESLGLETTWFPETDECCGGLQLMDQPETLEPFSQRIIQTAERWGVDILAVACSQCHSVLEGSAWSDRIIDRDGVLVMHYSQIAGLLMGLDEDSLFLSTDDDTFRDPSRGSLA